MQFSFLVKKTCKYCTQSYIYPLSIGSAGFWQVSLTRSSPWKAYDIEKQNKWEHIPFSETDRPEKEVLRHLPNPSPKLLYHQCTISILPVFRWSNFHFGWVFPPPSNVYVSKLAFSHLIHLIFISFQEFLGVSPFWCIFLEMKTIA